MNINHATRLSFNRDFYAIDVKQNGTLDIKVRTLNIFQRALRFLFGAYSNTIWNQSKSTNLMTQYPGEWTKIEKSIVNDVVFTRVFKIAKSHVEDSDSDSEGVEDTGTDEMPSSTVIPKERPAPATMSTWKKFARDELQVQLNHIGLEFKESTEKGDCFFDSVAYLLTALRGDKQYTAQDIRAEISDYLASENVTHEKYKKLLKTNHVDGNTYEKYCKNIGQCAGNGYDPIWGDTLAIQIISDLYNLNVTVYSAMLLPVDFEDIDDGGDYADYKSISDNQGGFLVCSKLDKKNFNPNRPNPVKPKDTIIFGHLSHNVWGHFVPVVKLK